MEGTGRRRGRKPKADTDLRKHVLTMRMTDREAADMRAMSEALGLDQSDLLRQAWRAWRGSQDA